MTSTRKGDWIQTYSGHQFWPMDPRPEDIHIEDIAHALSQTCRYGGHCREFYSVAQHSVLVCEALPDELKLWGLLHDASEAYISDIARPTKPYLTNYQGIEASIMAAVTERFGLSAEMPDEVKRVDTAILADEAAVLMGPSPAPWYLPEPPLGIRICGWTADTAKREFLYLYRVLTGETYSKIV